MYQLRINKLSQEIELHQNQECVYCGENGHKDCSNIVWSVEDKIGYQITNPTLSKAKRLLDNYNSSLAYGNS